MKKIVFTGGGTAGHIYPALAVAEKLKNYEKHYIGTNGIEKEILAKHKEIVFHEISAVKLERKLTPKNLLIPFKLHRSIKDCKKILQEISPNVIFAKGGFVSVPVALAAKKLNIPLVSHESDLSMGLANKIILRNCECMCTTFAKTAENRKKCVFTGQPLRQSIFEGQKIYNFQNNIPTILVLGGSQGSKFLNDIIFENIEKLCKNYNILHICGKKNYQNIVHENYKIFAYADNIQDFYTSADIVIARAGSGVINELLSLSKPMLLVPLSKKCSRGDQIENAKLFSCLGYAKVLEEEDYSFEKLENLLKEIDGNKEQIIKKMQKTGKNEAVSKIIFQIEKYEKK